MHDWRLVDVAILSLDDVFGAGDVECISCK